MRKRGKHFPGKGSGGNRLAWQNAISMQHGLTHDQRGDLGLAIHTGIERMRNGIGLQEDFWTFAAMANVSLILCERGVGADLIDDIFALQDALMEIKARHERSGKWGFSGAEMQAINLGARIHEQQIAAVPRIECREALFEARRRAARGDVLMRVQA